jgi:hypothetical protein
MGFVLKLVALLLIVAFGSFTFLTYYPSYDQYGVWEKVNSNLPQQVQRFTCEQVKKNDASANPPSCQTLPAN